MRPLNFNQIENFVKKETVFLAVFPWFGAFCVKKCIVLTYLFHIDADTLAQSMLAVDCITITSTRAIRRNLTLCQADLWGAD